MTGDLSFAILLTVYSRLVLKVDSGQRQETEVIFAAGDLLLKWQRGYLNLRIADV